MGGKKSKNTKKQEHYTVVFVPDGNHARIRTLHIPKSAVRSVLLSLFGVLILSVFFLHNYHDIKEKERELLSMREELMQQKAQVQNYALDLIDYKRQMFLLRDVDIKLRQALGLGTRDRAQQLLGIGGPDELGLENLTVIGGKKQDEALREMHQELTQLKEAASKQETSMQILIEYFEEKRSLSAATPSVWPVRGWISSPFGGRKSPVSGKMQFHEGMDIAAQAGTPVLAPADGMVIKSGYEAGFGNVVELSHGYGMKTIFAHNSELLVKPGQRVKRGDVVAYVGDTGSSTGPHLHYQVMLNGLPVNPNHYLP